MLDPSIPIRLGVDIGGTSVKAAVFAGHDCVRTGQSNFYARPDTQQLVRAIAEAAETLDRVDHVGLCVPGLMNDARDRVVLSVNVPGLMGIRLDELVPRALGLRDLPRTIVSNDAQSTSRDVARRAGITGRLLVLTLGTGVGAAVLDDGVSLDVEGGTPGHFGQIDVSVPGETIIGPDGGAGGLEGYIGVAALRRTYGDDVSAAVEAFDGDEPAIAALVRSIRIAHAIYRPAHIYLCGGVGIRLRHLLPTIERMVRDKLTSVAREGWTLRCGDDDFHAARGAALL